MSGEQEFLVGGMACQGCAKAVENAVKRVDPAAEVTVDLGAGTVRVVGGNAQPATHAAAIAGAGYEVRPAG